MKASADSGKKFCETVEEDSIRIMNEDQSAAHVVYVALGDSTGVGVGAMSRGGYVARIFERIERERPGSRVVNLCVSGATTEDVLRDQVGRVGEECPTLVTLGIGVNDVQRLMLEEYERNLDAIIRRVRSVTEAPIVLTNIPDIACAPGVPDMMRDEARRRINSFNDAARRVAERHQLTLIDLYTESHEILPQRPDYFCEDLFHPSDEGYEFWTDQMWPAVKDALP